MSEQLEILSLVAKQRIFPKERDNAVAQLLERTSFELKGSIGPIWTDGTAPKKMRQQTNNSRSIFVLAHGEAGSHLPPDPDARLTSNRYTETTFSVYVANYV